MKILEMLVQSTRNVCRNPSDQPHGNVMVMQYCIPTGVGSFASAPPEAQNHS